MGVANRVSTQELETKVKELTGEGSGDGTSGDRLVQSASCAERDD